MDQELLKRLAGWEGVLALELGEEPPGLHRALEMAADGLGSAQDDLDTVMVTESFSPGSQGSGLNNGYGYSPRPWPPAPGWGSRSIPVSPLLNSPSLKMFHRRLGFNWIAQDLISGYWKTEN